MDSMDAKRIGTQLIETCTRKLIQKKMMQIHGVKPLKGLWTGKKWGFKLRFYIRIQVSIVGKPKHSCNMNSASAPVSLNMNSNIFYTGSSIQPE